jgi:hypothetical protein
MCFATGDPSGLAAMLPGVLAQLRQVTGPWAKILLGLDRGGSYRVTFCAVPTQHAHWVTWRRCELAAITAPSRRHFTSTATARNWRSGKTCWKPAI